MLATGRLPEGPESAYEYRLDGYRACMQIAADGTTVLQGDVETSAGQQPSGESDGYPAAC
jgi:hypothetical protein